MSRPIALFLLYTLISALLAACSNAADAGGPDISQRKVRAVATTGMVADVVRNVGGNRVEVDQLMGSGIDPHLYKASEGDVIRLSQADLIFYSGLHLEARMADVLERIGESGWLTVAVAEAIPEESRLRPPEFEGFYDPHVWMDVKLWMHTIDVVTGALSEVDPEHAATYRENGKVYRAELEELERYVQQRVNELPPERRVLVTAHDAFNYFGTGYDFDVVAPQGISTVTEASVSDIRRTIDVVVERNIPAVFVESSVSPDIVEAVRAGARARGHNVVIGGQLFTDAMGDRGTPQGTYVGMIRHNIDTIVGALD